MKTLLSDLKKFEKSYHAVKEHMPPSYQKIINYAILTLQKKILLSKIGGDK